ncbi:MAG: LptF/LptG family permease [Verrucomicrobiae bacterium]|nr:LptF/LptG family permease [Verrucomicrobiae bacterium]
MGVLHRYLLTSHLVSLGMTLAVFTFVLLLGNIFKDLVALLSNRTIDVWTIGRFLALLMPYVLSFSMPMALLAATLLVMGAFSADGELTACRATGLSFLHVTAPIFGVAAALSLACLWVNCFVAPGLKHRFNQAFVELAIKSPISLLEEGTYLRDFQDMVLYIGRRDIRQNMLYDVRITTLENNEMSQEIHAERGALSVDPLQLKLHLRLFNAQIDQRDPTDPENIEKRKWGMTVAEYPLELDLARLIDQRRAVKEAHHCSSTELWRQARRLGRQGVHPTPMLVELHKRLALGTACLAFVTVAVPLGVRVHRRETSIGILISLVLAVAYYFLVLFAEGLKRSPHLYPEFVVWLPNLVFQAFGGYLLWRQQKT